MTKQLRKVTLYLSEEEHAEVQAVAEDEEVSVGAILRARLGLTYKRRGAPKGNVNRQPKLTAHKQPGIEKVVDANHA